MKISNLCPLCNGPLSLITGKPKDITFRKENFKVFESYYKCDSCGEELIDDTLGDKNIHQVYNQYREKYKILFPSEITSLRNKYGLTKNKMSLALGWGENTYSNYEKGAIPNESHNSILRLIEDPIQFLKLIEYREDLFSKSELKEIEKIAEKQNNINTLSKWIEELWPKRVGSDTGYVKPNFEKFINIILFFASKEKPYKTKLNKLLFYVDFEFYKNYIQSITGCRYVAIKYGPVPNDYDAIYSWLFMKKYIDIKEHLEECGVTEKIANIREPDMDLFNEKEIQIIEKIYHKFKNYKPSEISKYSHKEIGWIENKDSNGIIDYQKYAIFLQD